MIEDLRKEISQCPKIECSLHPSHGYAKQVVPGYGCASPKLMFVGEAPGADEDLNGRPFVGDAGRLLTVTCEMLGIKKRDEEVYISNIAKCRPPDNRDPLYHEMICCVEWLNKEIYEIKPDVIITLGRIAKDFLIPGMPKITQSHGRMVEKWVTIDISASMWKITDKQDQPAMDMKKITFMMTYHPSFIKRQGGIGSQRHNEMIMDLEGLIDKFFDKEKGWKR